MSLMHTCDGQYGDVNMAIGRLIEQLAGYEKCIE